MFSLKFFSVCGGKEKTEVEILIVVLCAGEGGVALSTVYHASLVCDGYVYFAYIHI